MAEINNQRKAFLDMLGVTRTITDVRKPEIMVMTAIVGGAIYRLLRSPLGKLVTLNPKLKSTGAGRYQLLPAGGCLPQAAWPERLLSEKSGRCGIAAD